MNVEVVPDVVQPENRDSIHRRERRARRDDALVGGNGFYRFDHRSFKVYRLQADTITIVAALHASMHFLTLGR